MTYIQKRDAVFENVPNDTVNLKSVNETSINLLQLRGPSSNKQTCCGQQKGFFISIIFNIFYYYHYVSVIVNQSVLTILIMNFCNRNGHFRFY